MPPDEHESLVAAWLDDPSVQREIAITQLRFPGWSMYEVATFTLGVLTYEAIDAYGQLDEPPPDTPPDEPWKHAA